MSKDFRKDPRLTPVPGGKKGDGQAWPKPDWSLLPGKALPPPPVFPLDDMGLPKDWIAGAADGANVFPDYVAASLLAAVGAVCGKMFEVCLSSDWREPLALWMFCVGPPSSGKTPALKPVRKTLDRIELDMRRDTEAYIREHLDAAKVAGDDGLVSELQDHLKALPRLVVQDSTREQLAHIEACSPRGLLVFRDELAGLLFALEQYSTGTDRPFYLEGWSGGMFRVDRRADGGSVILEDHLFSLLGNIQPDKLREIFPRQASDDGFAARALMVWPAIRPRKGIPEGADHGPLKRALERLAWLHPPKEGEKFALVFSDKARRQYEHWSEKVDAPTLLASEGKLASAYGKFPGQVARLAGILHLLDWAFGFSNDMPNTTISHGTLKRAIHLVEAHFRLQARRVYEGLDISPAQAMAGAILDAAREHATAHFNGRSILREWGLQGGRGKDALALRNKAFELLQEGKWIRRVGRSNALDFAVNPALFSEEEP